MGELLIRPVTLADASALNELLAAAEVVDGTGEHYNLDDVLEDLANPMIDPARDWILVEQDGVVVAHSRLLPRAPADGSVSVALDGTVHPEHRRQGIGSRVLPLMVERARNYVRERGADLRAVVTAEALTDNTDVASVLGRSGMLPDRWSFAMRADLTGEGAAPPVLPSGYTLHTWEAAGHDELRDVHNRAFPSHPGFTPWNEEMWHQWVAGSRNHRPALSLVARGPEDTIASYVHIAEYDAVTEATGVREAYVAKVGTLEEHRRHGLAGALLQITLERCREDGFDRAALDVDSANPTGALGLYERVGFHTHLRWTGFRLG